MTDRKGTTAANWYTDEAAFRQLCGDAVSLAKDGGSQEFANQMMEKANQYGLKTFLSYKQLCWLCRIADHQRPREFIEAPQYKPANKWSEADRKHAEAEELARMGKQPELLKDAKDFDDPF